ncbi:ABC transporter permease subunit [Rhizobium lusitanum]|uniref:ABC transporter permease subunit n=2 Tax=Rhizobium TaxID=379 RepID=UPI0019574688|nr:branched-chain amino acid ABC transporter permease [Rhizobium lusitanum]MBM7046557.1 branched-chain amino acid ABC transporter permease [Rhizobium lusitanum]
MTSHAFGKFLDQYAGAGSFLSVCLLLILVMFGLPLFVSTFDLLQVTILAVMSIFALSQGFVWGFAGIMSFGQAGFLGLGAYAYAVAVINYGDSTLAVPISIILPMLFAAVMGYFMFYGRISDAYVGVITLTVSVILFQLINSTSGSQYRIGVAELGGFNGIPAIPPLNLIGDPSRPLDQTGIWYATMGGLLLVYGLLRFILMSRFGRVVVAIRENETRAQLIGYDPRLFKLLAFVIGAGIAGLAGCLYVNWAGYISPGVFALTMSAQAIIFVLVGGLGTLLGPILGAVLIQWLINTIGDQGTVDPGLGLGIILVAFVLLFPKGIVPLVQAAIQQALTLRKRNVGSPLLADADPLQSGAE